VLLAFLLIALAGPALVEGGSRWVLVWLGAGSSLWLPYSLYTENGPQAYQLVWWIGGAAAIWWYAV